jgi:methylated-DNA-[protein]-cysteine S-methyltransferase
MKQRKMKENKTKQRKKFEDRIYSLCRKIPKGRVSTYGELAKALHSRAFRAVGQAMRHNPYAPAVPCHRVVASDGTLGGFGGKMNSRKKVAMLRKEGVFVKKRKNAKKGKYKIKDFEKRLFRF